MGMSGQTLGVHFFVSLDSIWSARTLDLKIFFFQKFGKIWKFLTFIGKISGTQMSVFKIKKTPFLVFDELSNEYTFGAG